MAHSPMDSMVHSPIEVSSISPDQLHITPIATIDQGRERSVEDFFGDDNPDVVLHEKQPATRVRLLPLGPAAPIDKMSQVHFRFPSLDTIACSFQEHIFFRPNGTIFDCELGCFVPIEEYQRRCSNENLAFVKEEEEKGEDEETRKAEC